jgi:hypothetical protein
MKQRKHRQITTLAFEGWGKYLDSIHAIQIFAFQRYITELM